MTLFDPFADLTQLRQQIDRLFQEAVPTARPQTGGRVWRPAVDIFEDDDGFTVKVDLPEADRDSLDVQVTAEELILRGERRQPSEPGTCIHSERPYGPFQRVFRLGVPVQHDGVRATYRDGVLTVRLPKAEGIKPRRVAVTSETQA